MSPRISAWYLIAVRLPLSNCASPDLHWPTTKPVLPNDVASSTMFSKASPDHLMSVAGARVPLAHLPILAVYEANATNQVLRHWFQWAQSLLQALEEFVSGCWRSLCRSLAVLTIFLLAPREGADADPAEGSGPSTGPPSSAGVTPCLLESPACSPDCAHVDVLSWSSWTTCATSVASRCLIILSIEILIKTKMKNDSSKKSARRDKGGNKYQWPQPSCFGGCLNVSPVVHPFINKAAETD